MTRTMARKGNGWQFDYYRPSFKEWLKIVFGWPIFTADGDMVVGVAKHRDEDR